MCLRIALLVAFVLVAGVLGDMYGSQSITPHDYQSLGSYLASSAPSCGYPYVSLDISRITAVQLMEVGLECGTCLRIETAVSNYIEDGTAVGLPEVAMATHFAATTSKFEQLPTTAVAERQLRARDNEQVRYIHVLAVDTGGRGLDLAQVSFTALFGQSLSPMDAAWFPVDAKYCEDIWRNSTKRQAKSPTSMDDIPVNTGRSQAPPGLGPVGHIADDYSSAAQLSLSLIMLFGAALAAAC
ncbi:hypothetical protein IWW55_000971 [Coemansia sp. RSA 2706]|nr:hypothetical protein IWW55_000971 [Coemansia sp. RSA 2706]KAJ2313565.1 hypothetical protein IWW54_001437 [Coemansia sp. RSA 2705]KAJ2322135.1 hypothetical protein IWW52_000286 [Coemansia sp. RSA 2704]KAJ2328962.1 hypothetical protein IWW51_000892 [Coemansia sp. RSA 2702]KAJ2367201.1 hypothetical protein H4S01_002288 [Coemansia sp. RSA 2610]KAJ2392416.1 hypothetical protein H4S02_000801 [Coemansia sp. RSA 2611]KAJ2738700.1 hypothetical protein H4R23_000966 [Coemansia sp. Cherry 401B]